MDHATISSTTDNATTSSKTNGVHNRQYFEDPSLMDNSTVSSPTNQAIILSPIDKCNYPLPWSIQQSVHPWTMQLLYLLTNRQEGTTEREVSLLVRVESCEKWCRWLCGSSPRCECSSHGLLLRTFPLASLRWSTTAKHHPCYSL